MASTSTTPRQVPTGCQTPWSGSRFESLSAHIGDEGERGKRTQATPKPPRTQSAGTRGRGAGPNGEPPEERAAEAGGAEGRLEARATLRTGAVAIAAAALL
jgi:hypothetical protein